MPDYQFDKLWIDNAELNMLLKYKAIKQPNDPLFQGSMGEYYEKVLTKKLKDRETIFDRWDTSNPSMAL